MTLTPGRFLHNFVNFCFDFRLSRCLHLGLGNGLFLANGGSRFWRLLLSILVLLKNNLIENLYNFTINVAKKYTRVFVYASSNFVSNASKETTHNVIHQGKLHNG